LEALLSKQAKRGKNSDLNLKRTFHSETGFKKKSQGRRKRERERERERERWDREIERLPSDIFPHLGTPVTSFPITCDTKKKQKKTPLKLILRKAQ
jgi:hypothetical protein